MSQSQLAYALVLGASACFSFASLIFADLSRKISPLWMNAFKAGVAWLCFAATVWIGGLWMHLPVGVWAALLVSGGLGLALGDIFLLTAYARIGAARTLILYGFQPVFIGIGAHFLFHQDISWSQSWAVLFFLGCLFVFSLERFRRDGHWETIGLLAALAGVLLDNCGLLISRWAFETAPEMHPLFANVIRCTGALLVFFAIGEVRTTGLALRSGWRALDRRSRVLALVSSVMGTFFSLGLYLTAVKIGHLASIAALGGAGPILSSGMECLYLRRPPSKYLLTALALFLIGLWILL